MAQDTIAEGAAMALIGVAVPQAFKQLKGG